MEANIELLAPAGSAESLRAAVNAGADAVYMGSSRFGARAYADNPDEPAFLEAMDYAHLHGRKVYLTVNTLLKQSETQELCAYLRPFYERGIDAVIVQDYGALLLIRNCFPDLAIHASTQMTVTGRFYAAELKRQGVSRLILPRELSLSEIKKIAGSADIELECFVHGALCYCYSGQCLMSSLIGGRSGNRGRCAQPCRLSYSAGQEKDSCLLSMKDLETITILPDIIEAGVSALKIEGRMKSPRYTAGVVSIYRKYLDLYKNVGRSGYVISQDDIDALKELFDRGGTTRGYFYQHNGKDMIARGQKPDFRPTNASYFATLDNEYVNAVLKIPINGKLRMHEGEPISLTVSDPDEGGSKVTVKGAEVQPAKTAPLTADAAAAQIRKTGNSLYCFKDLDCDLKGSCFLPVKELNELRRRALGAFEEARLDTYRRNADENDKGNTAADKSISGAVNATEVKRETGKEKEFPSSKRALSVSIQDMDLLDTVLSSAGVSEVCLDSADIDAALWKRAAGMIHGSGKKCALILPAILRDEAIEYFDRYIFDLKDSDFDELIIRSLEEPGYLREKGIDLPLVFDSNIYAWNKAAREGYKSMGASRLTLPVELNSRELLELDSHGDELIVYGHLPVMVTAQCVRRTVSKCDKLPGCLYMKDRTGRDFPVKNTCRFCYNTIYNPMPLNLLGEGEKIEKLDPSVLRLSFTVESPKEAALVIKAFEQDLIEGRKAEFPFKDYTHGHFMRGVE